MLIISEVGPSPNIKKLFLRLLEWDDELLSTPKIATFLGKLSPNFYKPFPLNAFINPLTFITNFYNICRTKKSVFNVKLSSGFFGHVFNS